MPSTLIGVQTGETILEVGRGSGALNRWIARRTTGRNRLVGLDVNPQAALAFALEGPDPYHLSIPPAPTLDSAEAAGEMVELYWQALTHDVPFLDYGRHSATLAAAAELSALGDFRGPQYSAATPRSLRRAGAPPPDSHSRVSVLVCRCP